MMLTIDTIESLEKEIDKISNNEDLTGPQRRKRIMELLRLYPAIETAIKDLFKEYKGKRKRRKYDFDLLDLLEESLLGKIFNANVCFVILSTTYSNDDILKHHSNLFNPKLKH